MALVDAPQTGPDPVPEGPITVILLEDDAGDAFLVQELLREGDTDIDISWYRSVAEAADVLRGSNACVLLDLHLPDVTGIQSLRTVLKLAPRASVVVLTGLVDRASGVQAVAAGAQDFLIKDDVDGPLLARSIRYAVERKRADGAARAAYEAELRSQENARLERGLLPRPVLRDETLHCVVRYRPGGRRMLLGGDFYDAVETTDGWLRATIGDVCGHGPDEAALGVNLRIAWRTLVLAGHEPSTVLAALDEVLLHERAEPGVFVTLCDVAISPDRRTLHLATAGHPGPLLLQPRLEELPVTKRGPALGLIPDARWPVETLSLPESWSLVLYTDGVVEGRVGSGTERLGTEGLVGILQRLHDDPDLQTIAEVVLAEAETLHGGPLPDDVALLMLSHDAESAPSDN
jgi:serine phosphatase RsbU (regulator of sigma subunit)